MKQTECLNNFSKEVRQGECWFSGGLITLIMLDCRKCKEIKEINFFSKKSKSKRGYSYICKKCHNEYSRNTWYKNNSEKQIKSSAKWKSKNKFKCLARKYNSTESFISELFQKSNHKCECCGLQDANLNIDHCHTSGIIRGLLCGNCNKALGFVFDNKDTLRNMIKYLSRDRS